MDEPRAALLLSVAAFVGACWSSAMAARCAPPQAVVLIGMRGAGKTTLGKGAAEALGCEFEDLDETLEEHVGMTCREFVATHGWAAFRSREFEVLAGSLATRSSSGFRVVACGGGVVESRRAMALLREWQAGMVVWIDRPINAIVEAFGADAGRPWGSFDEAMLRDTFARRKPLYKKACDKRFAVPSCSVAEATAELSVWLRKSIEEWDKVKI